VALSSPNENPSEAIDTDIDAGKQIVDQILSRFAMRHTALSERERIALVHTIIREARAQNLDPNLVVAVIEVESAGYHLAVSHVGAMGLMQLLPSTGKELAAQMNIEWKGPDTLFDPIINVRLGTAYLRQLADRFGSVHTALAAYNWGPGRINRRLRRGATVPSGYIEQVMRAVDRNAMTAVSRS
jgi:soluble lytic murein transglycosylase